MAEIIPALNKQTLSRMTAGEKRLARRLESLLEDDYLVWYDIPVGGKRRYPDFIILHPQRGLLFLEVKDWKPSTLKRMSKSEVTLLTDKGEVTKPHPLEQVRQCTYSVINLLSNDPSLLQDSGNYQGNLIMPYGWGVVFTNITRKQIEKGIPEDRREQLLPDHLVIYQDEMTSNVDAEQFQEQLWGMFHYQFGNTLTLPQIDRVRCYLFPEIRIDDPVQEDLFAEESDEPAVIRKNLPDIIKIMDIQQEQLARSLGDGHRVIHGVAGSGKTMILGFRCLYLAEAMHKPILVLVFNITLAAKLRSFISAKGIGSKVQVFHFHDWCGQQLKTYHVKLMESTKPFYERYVDTLIHAVNKERIPRAQYGAVLIDEGHDFEAKWLELVVQMIDPESNSLLLLYDDAQSIYKNRSGLGFSLSSVGIQAKGRTTVLKLNYRNTREILEFAYAFSRQYLDPQAADDDHIPLIEPESAGTNGPKPAVHQCNSLYEEVDYIIKCLNKWHASGVPWSEMSVLYCAGYQGELIGKTLQKNSIPFSFLKTKQEKSAYDPSKEQVTVMSIHSSKGLEFPRVIIVGIGSMKDGEDRQKQNARLIYVGMTRAQQYLLLTLSGKNPFVDRLVNLKSEIS